MWLPGHARAQVAPAPEGAPPPKSDPAPDAPEARLNPTNRAISFLVPVIEMGPLGQATIEISPDDVVRVHAGELAQALGRLITSESADKLLARADPDGFMALDAAETDGFVLSFDPGLSELSARIPFESRRRRSIPLGFGSFEGPPIDTSNRSEFFSAFLNFRISTDYNHVDEGSSGAGFQSPRVDSDLNGRVGAVAYQNRIGYDDAGGGFFRSSSRLIYDQVEAGLRWATGDLDAPTAIFQGSPRFAGLSVSRNVFQQGRVVSQSGGQTLTLREASTVEIFVNGVSQRRFRLQPGVYDLFDLPIGSGPNDIEIVAVTDSGLREVVRLSRFSDSQLLPIGKDEFFIGGGIRSESAGGEPDYQTEEPLISGFYRRGWTDQLTAGAYLQADEAKQQAGVESLLGSGFGLFYNSVAASQSDLDDFGYALRTEWRNNIPLAGDQRGVQSFGVVIESRSRNFTDIEQDEASNPYALVSQVRYSRPLTQSLNASLSAEYSLGRDETEDRYGATAFLSYALPRDTDLTFSVGYQSDADDPWRLGLTLRRRFNDRLSGSASAETEESRLRAGASWSPIRPIDDFAASVDLVRTEDSLGASGAVTYLNNRGDFDLTHVTTFGEASGEIDSQRTSARYSAAIAFTGGRLAIGRPLQDSFAIVGGHPSLEGRQVLIAPPLAPSETARSGLFGPALVDLGSYSPQEVPYDVRDLPLGYDLGAGNFPVFPYLHSGYAFTVGSAYNVTILGTLLDIAGRPLALAVGEAVSESDPDAPKAQVVSNRTGRFGATGLGPGRWRIEIRSPFQITYKLEIPEGQSLYRAGSLTPAD